MAKENRQELRIPQAQESQRFGIEVEGGWGEFYTASSKVLYVSANARFTNDPQNDHEHSLIKHLTPVREIIKTKDVAFSELLQRDLDDFRVAHDMIPYLLSPSVKGPVFFPPILAILIPYIGGNPSEIETIETQFADPNSPDENRSRYENLTAGQVFKLSRLVNQEGNLSRTTRHAKLKWNDTQAKLIVIDGQHRAMALIAIYRTLSQAWEGQAGTEYKHFYDEIISQLVTGEFPEIEVPVTIAIFPELFGDRGKEIHTAARKLFVDVNRTAKTPSASRLILLSDQGLINVITRMMLEKIRERDSELKNSQQAGCSLLVTIEYDSHSTSEKEYAWHRPTAMTNLNLLREVVEISVACKSAFRERISAKYGGHNVGPHFDHLKRCLDLEQQLGQFPIVTVNGLKTPVKLEDFDLDYCHPEIQEKIFDLFYSKIGRVIDGVLRWANPYSAHVIAIEKLQSTLVYFSLEEKLVRQALFDGVGTYWTLKSFGEKFENENVGLTATERQNRELRALPAVKSWKEVEKAKALLLKETAQHLLGNASDESVSEIKALKAKTETMACQIGLIMTAIHVQELYKLKVRDTELFTEIFCKYINKVQIGESSRGAKRPLIMTGDIRQEAPFNFLKKLNPKNWLEFRCLWVELLAENQADFETEMKAKFQIVGNVSLTQSIQDARKILHDSFQKEIKQNHRHVWQDDVEERATDQALRKRFAAMERWLDWTQEKFFEEYKVEEIDGRWAKARNNNANIQVVAEPDDNQENDEEEADEEV